MPSCGARPGVVVVMVFSPRHGMVWRGATVLAVAALYAWWWFASHPVRRGLRHGLRYCLLVSWGVVQELVAASGSLIIGLSCGAEGHDPNCWGHGSRQSGWPLSQGPHRGSHPVVGRIVHASC